jgi:predicted amidophosphoribosyltransferase
MAYKSTSMEMEGKTKNCPSCGVEVDSKDNYCRNCGKKL